MTWWGRWFESNRAHHTKSALLGGLEGLTERWALFVLRLLAERSVAVGMAVTCHPPAQIRTCRITAYDSCLGFDAEAGYGIRMH